MWLPKDRQPMRLVILVIAALAGLFWAPQLLEGAPNSCSALAFRAVALEGQRSSDSSAFGQVLATGLARAFGGTVAEDAAARKYPDLPPSISCAALYWQAIVDPASLNRIAGEERTD
jgi:hypothetical protein